MKTLLLSLSLCLSCLIADEAQDVVAEEVQIDPLISVKEQFSKARKKGWDFSAEKKKNETQKKESAFELRIIPPNYQPMQKSEEMMKAFRSDLSEAERGKRMDRISEMDHLHRYPGQR